MHAFHYCVTAFTCSLVTDVAAHVADWNCAYLGGLSLDSRFSEPVCVIRSKSGMLLMDIFNIEEVLLNIERGLV